MTDPEYRGVTDPAWGWRPPPPVPVRSVLKICAVVAGGAALLGVPFGLLWSALAPAVPLRMTERGPVYAEAQPQQLAGADTWFVLLGLPFGVLLAVGVWLVAGRVRGLSALGALLLGAVAAGLLAWLVGRQLGLAGYESALAVAEPGDRLDRPPDLGAAVAGWWPPRVTGVLLVPALAAAVTYTLLASWSRFSTLRPDYPELAEFPVRADVGQ